MPIQSLHEIFFVQLNRLKEESGQDLVEYAVVLALIALAAVMGMNDLANGINSAFNVIAATITQYF